MECRDCGREFDPKNPQHKKHGFFNQCGDCGMESDVDKPTRHVGIQGGEGINKAANIAIIRNPNSDNSAMAHRANSCGYHANVFLDHLPTEKRLSEKKKGGRELA